MLHRHIRGWSVTWVVLLGLGLAAVPSMASPDPADSSSGDGASEPATGKVPDHPELRVGSYGRVGAGTDLRGSTPHPVSVVAHGPRIVETPYTELDFYFAYPVHQLRGVRVRTVATLASADELFHYTGEFTGRFALRNLFGEAVIASEWTVWVGSRMVRGDDIYLLDFWPLDNSNLVGAGATFTRDRLHTGVHVGANRLLDPYQYQERQVPDPEFGAQTIVELDRQRMLSALHASYRLLDPDHGFGLKAKAYAEFQGLPAGTRVREDETVESLPSDLGWTLGAQLGAWADSSPTVVGHANLFVRFARGLSAFDELSIPTGFDRERRISNASELVFGLSGHADAAIAGVGIGAYSRRFVDADPNTADHDDGWEYAADIRPYVNLGAGSSLSAAVDLSYQRRMPRGLSPTSSVALDPGVLQIAPMLVYSPFGPGFYRRPQFRLVYRAAGLNAGARDLYSTDDPRRHQPWVHYVGAQVEWWFHSSYR